MGKIYVNENKILLNEIIEIYKPEKYDWLSYQITKNNILTIHHVIKVADGGILCIENAALLTKKAHRALHMCESRDLILYIEINEFFKEIISYRFPLTEEQQKISREYKKALTKTIYK